MSNDGGPAFPVGNTANMNGTIGMTLRDYFAGQALAGYMASGKYPANGQADFAGQTFSEWAAANAYEYADAMLSERKEGQS